MRDLWTLYLFVVVYGLLQRDLVTSITGLLGHLFGTKALARLTGITWGIGYFFALFGPLTAGFLFDKTATYFPGFLIAAIFFAIVALLALMLRPLGRPMQGSIIQNKRAS